MGLEIKVILSDEGICELCGSEDTVITLSIPFNGFSILKDTYMNINVGEKCKLSMEAELRRARKAGK